MNDRLKGRFLRQGPEFLPEKDQNNMAGLPRHDASTASGERLWLIENFPINV